MTIDTIGHHTAAIIRIRTSKIRHMGWMYKSINFWLYSSSYSVAYRTMKIHPKMTIRVRRIPSSVFISTYHAVSPGALV
jgi:hypothetical protein